MLLAIIAVVVLAAPAAYFWVSKQRTPSAAAFSPPPHSIAVLPFVNLSGDKEQEYFSDGLTEELLNSLTRINELQVAARTSSFVFKGEKVDVATIARKLDVAAVLEGSVRRSGNTVRITAQLINAVTGFHLWSETYDRDLGDVLKLQTEIASAVTSALKITLLGDTAARVELGGTHNAAAFDAYLRGSKALSTAGDAKDAKGFETAIAAYTEAIGLDPNYALALAGRSITQSIAYGSYTALFPRSAIRVGFDRAQQDARKAVALAPELAEAHRALALYFETGPLDFARADQEYERAASLAPGDAALLRDYGQFAAYMGRSQAGVAAARRAVVGDRLNPLSHKHLADALFAARRYAEANAAYQDLLSLDPEFPDLYGLRGLTDYAQGNFQSARALCETKPDWWLNQMCLAVTYDKLGRRADAEVERAKLQTQGGDAAAYQYAEIYAQWGNTSKALAWLDTAVRLRDSGLVELKTDVFMDPLRKEPRFQAIERELKFPE
ncbi:MAG: hypothetical protein JO358_03515 [Alphaproteobacteria bacterium]|nr:hypothetical protein [Alphaproteobacteria bacterium]